MNGDPPSYEPTGWWRSLLADGRVWGESSDEREIRRMATDAPVDKRPVKIQRHMRRVEERWEDVPAVDLECASCGEGMPLNECPKAQRPCGHHCNCSWIHDYCHWCGAEFSEAV